MKCKRILLLAAGILLLTGCASVPTKPVAFDTLWVEPNPVQSGNRVYIRVKVEDPGHVVQGIRASLLPDRSFSVVLNDQGQLGDRLAGDGEWGVYVDVAGAASAGIYPWEIELQDNKGQVIELELSGQGRGLFGFLKFWRRAPGNALPLRLKTVIEILPS